MLKKAIVALAAAGVIVAGVSSAEAQNRRLTGTVKIDGSSTVFPITEAVAEEFATEAPRVRVTVGISGTGGGFKRFVVGETDISNASRPIKASEYEAAKSAGVEFIEVPVAYDGLTIAVHPANYWVDSLTVDEIKKIFLEDRAAKRWSDVRAGWPDTEIKIYAPGTDSGTFDYFKEVVAGKKGSIRSDMSVSEDDNVLVRGVVGEENAIGFFGSAYYFENEDKLKAVAIHNGERPVLPTPETIESGEYAPFSRPLFIYVTKKSAVRPEVKAFVEFYLEHAGRLADEVGYVRLPERIYDKALRNFRTRKTGTHFLDENGEKLSGSLTKLFL